MSDNFGYKETDNKDRFNLSLLKSGIKKTDNYFIMPVGNMAINSISFFGKLILFPIRLGIFLISSFIIYEQVKKGVGEYKRYKRKSKKSSKEGRDVTDLKVK